MKTDNLSQTYNTLSTHTCISYTEIGLSEKGSQTQKGPNQLVLKADSSYKYLLVCGTHSTTVNTQNMCGIKEN